MKTMICQRCGKQTQREGAAKYCTDCANSSAIEKERYEKRMDKRGIKALCSFCGKKREHIHHINMNRQDNALINLLPLCSVCHLTIHATILRPFIRNVIHSLKKERFSIIEIANVIGLTRQRVYKILEKSDY